MFGGEVGTTVAATAVFMWGGAAWLRWREELLGGGAERRRRRFGSGSEGW